MKKQDRKKPRAYKIDDVVTIVESSEVVSKLDQLQKREQDIKTNMIWALGDYKSTTYEMFHKEIDKLKTRLNIFIILGIGLPMLYWIFNVIYVEIMFEKAVLF